MFLTDKNAISKEKMIISIYYLLWIVCFGMTILSPAGDETTSQDFDCVSVNASESSYECKYTQTLIFSMFMSIIFCAISECFVN